MCAAQKTGQAFCRNNEREEQGNDRAIFPEQKRTFPLPLSALQPDRGLTINHFCLRIDSVFGKFLAEKSFLVRKNEPVTRDGALFAVWLCAIKGLLTVIVFLALPHTPTQLTSHPPSFAQARAMIDAQLARATAAKAIILAATSAFTAEDQPLEAGSTVEPFALLPANEPQLSTELLFLVHNEDPNDKLPGLLLTAYASRAPPDLRHESPPDYHHHPRAPVGLLIAWATPPPSHV